MTDKNAANKITVGKVLGEYMQKRTVSCQWHYLRCVKKQSNRDPEKSEKKKFQEYSRAFVEQAINLNEYVYKYQSIIPLCKKYGCMKWLEFWHNRQAHFVPAFHGFGYPGLNLAKAGQSTKTQKQLTLVDAAFDDVIRQMQQDTIYQLTLQNEVKGLGHKTKVSVRSTGKVRRPRNNVHYDMLKPLEIFMKNKGNLWNEVLNIPSAHDPSAFHPDVDTKHKYTSDIDDDQKVNKKQGKQGQKRKAQTKDAASEDNVKKTKQGRGKGRGKTSMCPTFKCSQFQPGSVRTGYIYTNFLPGSTRTGYIYTNFQPGFNCGSIPQVDASALPGKMQEGVEPNIHKAST